MAPASSSAPSGNVENPLAELLLEGKFASKDMIGVDVDPIKAPGPFSFEKD